MAEDMKETVKKASTQESEKFQGNYFEWLKEELTGWDTLPWALFLFGVGFELATLLLSPINATAVISFIGIFFGMWCTVAMGAGGYRQVGDKKVRVSSHAINGLLGAFSVIAYIYVNFQAGHWFSIIDQLCFFFLIDVELMFSWRTWGRGSDNKVKALTKKGWVTVILAILIAWGVLYYVGVLTHDSQPIVDALVLAIGGTASWLCFRHYSTTYTLWLCSDVINVILWFVALQEGYSQAALPMLVMTLFYLATAIMGKVNWKPTE